MRLVHPNNIPSVEKDEKFNKAVEAIRLILNNLFSSGCPKAIAEDAAKASNDPARNRIILYRLMGGLMSSPTILTIVTEDNHSFDESFIENVFFTAFDGYDLDVTMDPTVPIRLPKKEDL